MVASKRPEARPQCQDGTSESWQGAAVQSPFKRSLAPDHLPGIPAGILTWLGPDSDHQGCPPRARPLPCTLKRLTPASSSNVATSTAQFLLVGGLRTRSPPFSLSLSLSLSHVVFKQSHGQLAALVSLGSKEPSMSSQGRGPKKTVKKSWNPHAPGGNRTYARCSTASCF